MAEEPPVPESTPEPQPAAAVPVYRTWKGEMRTYTETVEGPGGELVEVVGERTPAEFVYGVPARDLSQTEYEALSAEQQHLVDTCGLYAAGEEA